MKRKVEYRITYIDGDIDHVSWREAKKLLTNPQDIILVERVTRKWRFDGQLTAEDSTILFEGY